MIDGKVAFTGGVNIGDEYTGRKRKVGAWRDTHLRIQGPAVNHLQEVFAEDWHFATGEDLIDETWYPDSTSRWATPWCRSSPAAPTPRPSRSSASSSPRSPRPASGSTSPRPTSCPTRRCWWPWRPLRCAASTCALLLPHRSDMRLVLHAGRSYYDELLSSGVKIYEYQPGILHAKTMVVDDSWATVGSANMDVRSLPAQLRGQRRDLRSRSSPASWPRSSSRTSPRRAEITMEQMENKGHAATGWPRAWRGCCRRCSSFSTSC